MLVLVLVKLYRVQGVLGLRLGSKFIVLACGSKDCALNGCRPLKSECLGTRTFWLAR